MDENVSIGTVKRDISELVNRVAYGGERIVLTSRGKPKAVIVSIDDYGKLQEADSAARRATMKAWLARSAELSEQILSRRGGVLIDVDEILRQDRADLEARDDRLFRGN
ncbi:MAG TPA: type II toxin-antitoxin system Phd/YefM family antitoxin [Anaerolineales bacterium]|nr:type II toxin-antitoxin system Phd/YefM family antitoxin [Anaerolineales bacterium]